MIARAGIFSKRAGQNIKGYSPHILKTKAVLIWYGLFILEKNMKSPYNKKAFYTQLLSISIPIALQNLIIFGVSAADSLMLSKIGSEAISAATIANQPFFIFQMFIFGLAGGGSVLCSQYWGKGDIKRVKSVVLLVVSIAFAVGFLLTILVNISPMALMKIFVKDEKSLLMASDYLKITSASYTFFGIAMGFTNMFRSVESVRASVFSAGISFLVNILLNYILIFGKLGFSPLGIKGAAIATLIARIVDFLIISAYVLHVDKKVKIRLEKSVLTFPERPLLRSFLRYSLPVVTNELSWALAISAQSAILGRISSGAVAAASIANTASQLVTVLIFGLSNASGVMVGKKIGQGEMQTAKAYSKTLLNISLIVGLVAAVILFSLTNGFVTLYSLDEATASLARKMLTVTAVITFFNAISAVTLVGILRGASDTKFCMTLEISALWLFSVPLGALCAFFFSFPPPLVYLILKLDEPLKSFIAFIRCRRARAFSDITY